MIDFKIIPRKRIQQTQFGFYRSGIYKEQVWYGLEIPYLDFRLIIYKENNYGL